MTATILSLFAGMISKVVVGLISSWAASSNLRNIATSNADTEKLKALNSGLDNADWSARITRIFIVLPIVYVFLALCVYIVIYNPTLEYTIEVNRYMSPFWQFLMPFPINEKGFVQVTGVFVIERVWMAVFYVIGFYLTKWGK